MTLIVGRQPVLNQHGVTYGYELLYRGDGEDAFHKLNGEETTSRVINSVFYESEIAAFSSGKKSFINFTTALILDELWRILPKHQVVIEFVESVRPTPDILAAAKVMKNAGYTIALDDFVYHEDFLPLIELVDIIKVDIQLSDYKTIETYAQAFLPKGKILLAEKVETLQAFKDCRSLGYTLFQGYYFAFPQLLNTDPIPDSKASKLRLMQKIHQPEVEYGELVDVLKSDPSLSLKLLKYINSVSMGVRHEITSLRQALALIGLINFKKWASVLILASIAEGKPRELLRMSLFRGRFCELLSDELGLGDHSSEIFLVGIFSLLDATLDKPMETLVQDLPLADEIIETLLGHKTIYQQAIKIVSIMEEGTETESRLLNMGCKISIDKLIWISQKAITWSDDILTL